MVIHAAMEPIMRFFFVLLFWGGELGLKDIHTRICDDSYVKLIEFALRTTGALMVSLTSEDLQDQEGLG